MELIAIRKVNHGLEILKQPQLQSSQPSKGNSLRKNTSYDVQIVKIGSSVFAQLTLLPTA